MLNRAEIEKRIKDKKYFRQVKPFMGTITWPHGQDVCPDTLYIKSKQNYNKQIRGEIKFANEQELVEQLKRDEIEIRELMSL